MKPQGRPELDAAYAKVRKGGKVEETGEERMLLDFKTGADIALQFRLPEMEIEIERAVEQVEASIAKQAEGEQEKKKEG